MEEKSLKTIDKKAYNKNYYEINKRHILMKQKEYREKYRKEISEHNKLLYSFWKDNNPEYIRKKIESTKIWRDNHRERYNESHKRWRNKNRDKLNLYRNKKYKEKQNGDN